MLRVPALCNKARRLTHSSPSAATSWTSLAGLTVVWNLIVFLNHTFQHFGIYQNRPRTVFFAKSDFFKKKKRSVFRDSARTRNRASGSLAYSPMSAGRRRPLGNCNVRATPSPTKCQRELTKKYNIRVMLLSSYRRCHCLLLPLLLILLLILLLP